MLQFSKENQLTKLKNTPISLLSLNNLKSVLIDQYLLQFLPLYGTFIKLIDFEQSNTQFSFSVEEQILIIYKFKNLEKIVNRNIIYVELKDEVFGVPVNFLK